MPREIANDYKTSKGTTVPHFHHTGADGPYNDREALKRLVEQDYPPSKVVGDATDRYNCHGYAHAASHAWFEDVAIFLQDDYEQFTPGTLQLGDIVVYEKDGERTHSGVITALHENKAVEIRSKWGAWPLVRHLPDIVPEEYGGIRYYLRKRTAMQRTSDVLPAILADATMMDRLGLASTPGVFEQISRSILSRELAADFVAKARSAQSTLDALDKRSLALLAAVSVGQADGVFAAALARRYDAIRDPKCFELPDLVICRALMRIAEASDVAAWSASAISLATGLRP